MPRSPRINFRDAVYHVTSGGDDRGTDDIPLLFGQVNPSLPLEMERHQRLEWIARLVHGPSHGPQQNDPKVGIVEREIVVAGTRDEDSAAAHLRCPHDRPLLGGRKGDITDYRPSFVGAKGRSVMATIICRQYQ